MSFLLSALDFLSIVLLSNPLYDMIRGLNELWTSTSQNDAKFVGQRSENGGKLSISKLPYEGREGVAQCYRRNLDQRLPA